MQMVLTALMLTQVLVGPDRITVEDVPGIVEAVIEWMVPLEDERLSALPLYLDVAAIVWAFREELLPEMPDSIPGVERPHEVGHAHSLFRSYETFPDSTLLEMYVVSAAYGEIPGQYFVRGAQWRRSLIPQERVRPDSRIRFTSDWGIEHTYVVARNEEGRWVVLRHEGPIRAYE